MVSCLRNLVVMFLMTDMSAHLLQEVVRMAKDLNGKINKSL